MPNSSARLSMRVPPRGPHRRSGSVRPCSDIVRINPITPITWSAWKWVKKMSCRPNDTP